MDEPCGDDEGEAVEFSMPRRRAFIAVLVALSCVLAWSRPADAHRDGCHRWHSCPSDTGSYVCGDTGYFSECGYTSLPEESDEPVFDYDAPSRPIVAEPKTRRGGQVAVAVTAESGSNLVVKSGGKTVYETTATGAKQTLSFKGLDGTHQYSVQATDSSDNTSSVAKFKVTADGVAPSVDGVEIAAGTPANAYTRLTFAPGEVAGYAVTIDGRRVIGGKSEGDDQQIAFPVANGRHSLVLKLADTAGNISTFKRDLDVEVPALAPVLTTLTEPNEATQRFGIVGTPGSRGTLTVAGKTVPVHLEADTAELSVELPDGDYPAGTLDLRDELGRTGKVAVPAFTVDTTSPLLEVVRVDDDSATGRLVARITAEAGARVVWRILDETGGQIRRAAYDATDSVRTVDVDVDEGTATLEVEASDAVGNQATDDVEAAIEADPLGVIDWLVFVILLVVVTAAVAVSWRRRHALKAWAARQRRAHEMRKARRAHAAALERHAQQLEQHAAHVADYERRVAEWTARRQYLGQLLDEAQTAQGAETDRDTLLGAKVKKGERIFSIVDGYLLEQRTRQNVPTLVEVEKGQVAITNLRVLFQGHSKKREWAYDKLVRITPVDDDATLLDVSNRKSLSGVGYQDAERTRLHLDLALFPDHADRQKTINKATTALRGHENSRPIGPPPAPSAPRPPAVLWEEAVAPVSRT